MDVDDTPTRDNRRRRDAELLGDWSWEDGRDAAPAPGTAELYHHVEDPAGMHGDESDLGPDRPTIPPPRPADPRHPDGRRRVPAGHAILIALIALVVGTLLNADGMRKTAEGQPLGTARDVAVALTSALTTVTGALQIDEPRKLVKAALGRSDDDRFSTKVTVARTPRHRRPSGAEPVFGPRHHLRMYVTGDSLMIDPGPALLERAAASGVIDAVAPTDAHAATGLVRPEVFNWFEYLPQQVDKLKPDLTVLTFGGNDGQGIPGVPGAQDVGSPAWLAEYHRRVAGIMNVFTSRGVKLMWVGLPIPRDPGLARRFRIMNSVYRSEAAKRRGDVYFLDIYLRFADKHGHYADYLPDASGQLVKMRQADGIHLDTPGAQIVAQQVIDSLGKLVRLKGR